MKNKAHFLNYMHKRRQDASYVINSPSQTQFFDEVVLNKTSAIRTAAADGSIYCNRGKEVF